MENNLVITITTSQGLDLAGGQLVDQDFYVTFSNPGTGETVDVPFETFYAVAEHLFGVDEQDQAPSAPVAPPASIELPSKLVLRSSGAGASPQISELADI